MKSVLKSVELRAVLDADVAGIQSDSEALNGLAEDFDRVRPRFAEPGRGPGHDRGCRGRRRDRITRLASSLTPDLGQHHHAPWPPGQPGSRWRSAQEAYHALPDGHLSTTERNLIVGTGTVLGGGLGAIGGAQAGRQAERRRRQRTCRALDAVHLVLRDDDCGCGRFAGAVPDGDRVALARVPLRSGERVRAPRCTRYSRRGHRDPGVRRHDPSAALLHEAGDRARDRVCSASSRRRAGHRAARTRSPRTASTPTPTSTSAQTTPPTRAPSATVAARVVPAPTNQAHGSARW